MTTTRPTALDAAVAGGVIALSLAWWQTVRATATIQPDNEFTSPLWYWTLAALVLITAGASLVRARPTLWAALAVAPILVWVAVANLAPSDDVAPNFWLLGEIMLVMMAGLALAAAQILVAVRGRRTGPRPAPAD